MLALIALTGCAGVAVTLNGKSPSLEKTTITRCANWDACFKSADALCSGGYSIINQSDGLVKQIEVVCSEDRFTKADQPIKEYKVPESKPTSTKKTTPPPDKSQNNQTIEKIMDLQP